MYIYTRSFKSHSFGDGKIEIKKKKLDMNEWNYEITIAPFSKSPFHRNGALSYRIEDDRTMRGSMIER